MDFKRDQRLLIFAIFFFLILSYFIIKSFIVPLLFTFLLVYIFYPLYIKLKKYVKYHFLTSMIIILSLFGLIFAPFIYFFTLFSNSVFTFDYSLLKGQLNVFFIYLSNIMGIQLDFSSKVDSLLQNGISFLTNLTFNLPLFFFQIFLIIFFYYYFSREYNFEILFFRRIFGRKRFKSLRLKFRELINGIVFGQLLVRFIQSFIGLVGFLFLGIPYAFLWSLIMFFASFLPLVGTGLVWIPLLFYEFSIGNYSLSMAILLLGLFISVIDNILLPFIISTKIKISPVLILVSILGGLQLFGIYGLLLGPFSLGTLFLLIDEFIEDFKNNPRIRKFIWSEKERNKYRSLSSRAAREEYVKITNLRYQHISKENEVTSN